MNATATSWLKAREDRQDLVAWLAATVAAQRHEFLQRCLAALIETGRLTEAQESAVRRARARIAIAALRDRPEHVGKKAGVA